MMRRSRASGFAYVAAVVLLVLVAGVALAMLRLTGSQQRTADQALLSARASLAARAGIEWAFLQLTPLCVALPQSAGAPLPAVTPVLLDDMRSDSGFLVSVSCSYRVYGEGEQLIGLDTPTPTLLPLRKRIYEITAVACNGSGSTCPDPGSVGRADYVERARVTSLCMTQDGKYCN